MSPDSVAGVIVAAALLVYLVYVLLNPEQF
jgi:K+-transporting ATPase KdpF subunit